MTDADPHRSMRNKGYFLGLLGLIAVGAAAYFHFTGTGMGSDTGNDEAWSLMPLALAFVGVIDLLLAGMILKRVREQIKTGGAAGQSCSRR